MYFTFGQLLEQVGLVRNNGLIQVLVWLIMLDIFTGFIKSFKRDNSNSTTALFGVMKHTLVIMLTMVVNIYLPLFGYGDIANWIVYYLIVSYLISFTENWVLIGLPAPDFVIEKLDKLKSVLDTGKKVTVESTKEIIVEVKTKEEEKNE